MTMTQVTIRPASAADAPECGRICHDAFASIAARHGFPPDFPSVEVAAGLVSGLIAHPGFFGVVAEHDGRIVGSNFLDERSMIAGVGPITVDPDVQDRQVGRALMNAVLQRAADRRVPGVRLLQVAYHNRSMSLYAKLGFDVQEPFAAMQGDPLAAQVVDRGGRITGYTTGIAFFAHSVAETNDDLHALIGAAAAFPGPGFLVPMRNTELLRWCLAQGLRVFYVMNLMTIGLYQEPRGAFLASVLY